MLRLEGYCPWTRQFALTFLVKAAASGDLFILGIYENREGTCQSPRHPWAGCLTEILSYVVPFEKFSWCIRSEDLCINDIAVYKNNRILLFRIEKISCYSNILSVMSHKSPSHCSRPLARCHHAFSVLAETPALAKTGCRAFRAAKQPQQLTSTLFRLDAPGVAKQGGLRGSFGLRNFEMLPLRVFIFAKLLTGH